MKLHSISVEKKKIIEVILSLVTYVSFTKLLHYLRDILYTWNFVYYINIYKYLTNIHTMELANKY